MTTIVYGITNCDAVKKARRVDYEFHDYKKLGVDKALLKKWCAKFGWETVLNKRGTTFRQLADSEKSNLTSSRAITLMHTHTSMIKRPVIEHDQTLLIGFDKAAYEKTLT